jgi:hypothetical protein
MFICSPTVPSGARPIAVRLSDSVLTVLNSERRKTVASDCPTSEERNGISQASE